MAVNFHSEKAVQRDNFLYSEYKYENAFAEKRADGTIDVTPTSTDYEFRLDLRTARVGVMVVGLGGNNGTTLVALTLANKHGITYETKEGVVKPNYYGLVTQSSTVQVGVDRANQDVYAPFSAIAPLASPNDFVVGGWDISGANMACAMKRAQVLDVGLQQKVAPMMAGMVPLPSVYYPDFIASNQRERADNVVNGDGSGGIDTSDKWRDVERVMLDICQFKQLNGLDTVIVVWSANTERCVPVTEGVNDSGKALIAAIKGSHRDIAPSTVFAVACVRMGVPFINGSPQNTFVPGLVELAEEHKSFIGGDDFKSGQTKLKSVMAQFLVDAGIRPVLIASYNHLGNNDGYNLSAPAQFRSKEISKQLVIEDVIALNGVLYNEELGTGVDHCIVIKYLRAAGDTKVAMDEYYSELMMGGHNRISVHNVCEDSLLAVPLIIDLVVMTEFLQRVRYREKGAAGEYGDMYAVLSFLSYWLKAPLLRPGFKAVNGLNKQRMAVENLMRVLVGMPMNSELRFEERLS